MALLALIWYAVIIAAVSVVAAALLSRLIGWFAANVVFGYHEALRKLGATPARGSNLMRQAFRATKDTEIVDALVDIVDDNGGVELRDTVARVLALDQAAMRNELTEKQVRELLKNRIARLADFANRTLDVLQGRRS